MKKTIKVRVNDGSIKRIKLIATFCRKIGGSDIQLAVTLNYANSLTFDVTHLASGKRVCPVNCGEKFLKAFESAKTDVDRANVALDSLIAKYGEDRVLVVIESADALVQS